MHEVLKIVKLFLIGHVKKKNGLMFGFNSIKGRSKPRTELS